MAMLGDLLLPWLTGPSKVKTALRTWGLSGGDPALRQLFGGTTTAAGVVVTEQTALTVAAVWDAVWMISTAIATLPFSFYRKTGPDAREEYETHPLYRLAKQPNPENTSAVFYELLMQHVLLWGNAYAEIQRDQVGRPLALWPITPDRVKPERTRSGDVRYRVSNRDGGEVLLAPEAMFHVPGMGFDGLQGYSVIHMARESLGLAVAANQFGAKFFGNGAHSSVIATHPGRMQAETQRRFKDSLREAMTGDAAMGIVVVEEGITIERTTIPPDDAQFLETREFQIEEIARWFHLPLHKIKCYKGATYSNIEHQAIEYVQDTLTPWVIKLEQECHRKLVAPLEATRQYFKFNLKGRLRGDAISQSTALEKMWLTGNINHDEWRSLNELNPLPDGLGQRYFVPVNMIPVDRVDEMLDAKATPDPTPDPSQAADPVPADEQPQNNRDIEAIMAAVVEVRDAVRAIPPPEPPALPAAPRINLAQVAASQRALVAEVVRRMMARERDKAQRHAKDPETFRAWVGDFYAGGGKYSRLFESSLLPVLGMHVALTGDLRAPEDLAAELVASHLRRSQEDWGALLDSGPADLPPAIDALLARWDVERVGTMADAVMVAALEGAHG